MLLAGLVSDRSFFSQTAESFAVPFPPKTDAFLAVKDTIDISKLDFLVAFSSVSTFGNSGQTNYAAYVTLNSAPPFFSNSTQSKYCFR